MGTCPKCGFVQPKDRYCASCGVDMESYRAPADDFGTQIWKSPWTYGLLSLIAIGLLVRLVDPQKVELFGAKVFSWRGFTKVSRPTGQVGSNEVSEDNLNESGDGPNNSEFASGNPTTHPPPLGPPMDSSSAGKNGTQVDGKAKTSIRDLEYSISFYVVTSGQRAQLVSDLAHTQKLGSGIEIGVAHDPALLAALDELEIVDRDQSRTGTSVKKLFGGTGEGEKDERSGLEIDVQVEGASDGPFSKAKILILRKDEGKTTPIRSELSIEPGQAILVFGILDSKWHFTEVLEDPNLAPLFKAAERPDVRSNKSEVLSLIQIQDPGPAEHQ